MSGRIWRCPLGLYRVVSIAHEYSLPGLTSIIPMTFYVPVRMDIFRVVFLVTADLDLFEPPLRQHRVGSSEVTSQVCVSEP